MNDITEVDRLNAEIADLKRTIEWYQGRTGIMMGAAAEAALAAVPASEPVAYLVDWHDIGEGAGKSCFYDADAKQHMESAVSYALHARTRPSTVTPLYAAAPAPVSGMPDDVAVLRNWAVQIERMSSVFDDERSLLCQQAAILLRRIAYLPSPQAPDTPAAPEVSDDEWSVMMHGPKSIIKREDWDPVTRRPKVAAPLPEQTGPSETRESIGDDRKFCRLARAWDVAEHDEGDNAVNTWESLVAYIDSRYAASPSPAPAQQQEPSAK